MCFKILVSMNKYFIPTFVLFVLLVLLSLFGCQPIYKVSHRGSGIYTDTIRVIYDDSNIKTFQVPVQ